MHNTSILGFPDPILPPSPGARHKDSVYLVEMNVWTSHQSTFIVRSGQDEPPNQALFLGDISL